MTLHSYPTLTEVLESPIREKIHIHYPANAGLKALIEKGLRDSYCDFVMLINPKNKDWVLRKIFFRPVCFGIGFFAKELDWQVLWRDSVKPVR